MSSTVSHSYIRVQHESPQHEGLPKAKWPGWQPRKTNRKISTPEMVGVRYQGGSASPCVVLSSTPKRVVVQDCRTKDKTTFVKVKTGWKSDIGIATLEKLPVARDPLVALAAARHKPVEQKTERSYMIEVLSGDAVVSTYRVVGTSAANAAKRLCGKFRSRRKSVRVEVRPDPEATYSPVPSRDIYDGVIIHRLSGWTLDTALTAGDIDNDNL